MSELSKKVEQAIKLIKLHSEGADDVLEVAYSGGKDSDVILRLTQMAGVPYRAIYKNTTIDPPGTIKHAIDNGVEILQPKTTFFKLVEKKGLPNRFCRFCCKELKESKILDKCIVGVRADESIARKKRYTEPTKCFVYSKNVKALQILPIVFWSAKDVKEFVVQENIKLHDLYYNEDGTIDETRRLGCIGCPLAGKRNIIKGYKKYPKFLKETLKAAAKFCQGIENKPFIYKNPYKYVFLNIYAGSEYSKLLKYEQTLFGEFDYKVQMEKDFNIDLTI